MKKRREWFKDLPEEVGTKAINNSTFEALETPKNNLYDALCDSDGFDFSTTPEGYDYWQEQGDKIWAATDKETYVATEA